MRRANMNIITFPPKEPFSHMSLEERDDPADLHALTIKIERLADKRPEEIEELKRKFREKHNAKEE